MTEETEPDLGHSRTRKGPQMKDLPQRHSFVVLPLEDLVQQICDRAGVEKSFVGEITVTPGELQVRVHLKNGDGKKYVIGTKDDPACKGAEDRTVARAGQLAEEVVHFRVIT